MFAEGTCYLFFGTIHIGMNGASMSHPDFEMIESEELAQGTGLVPVYPLTAGITQKMMRALTKHAMPAADATPEVIPEKIVVSRHLAPPSYAFRHIHFPENEHNLKSSRYRLIYEELFLLQAGLFYIRSRGSQRKTAVSTKDSKTQLIDSDEVSKEFAGLLTYKLTGAQQRSTAEIYADIQADRPMARLLQGDVGSGKTAVAMAAALLAARMGKQTLYMAPTEILASQQYAEFERVFEKAGLKVGYLVSGLTAAEKNSVKNDLATGTINILVGTHALLEEDVRPACLGLAITDEQHRFGVAQRLKLQEKNTKNPINVLVMTATPIPRTLAMLLYGDLDSSVLDEMPPGREPVKTHLAGSKKRDATYDFAEKVMEKGHQVYVVAPAIEETEEDEAGRSFIEESGLKTVTGIAEELSKRFPNHCVSALHGRMKPVEKDEIMARFSAGEINLLVSTTVVEVGVNVPNATLMIVENAERFGLAQLHQLRGRVGRGSKKSHCILISDSDSELAVKRSEALESTNDGFRIAEMDLLLRGPGDLFGVRQHGLPELKIADPAKHLEVVREAGEDVKAIFAEDPLLEAQEYAALRKRLNDTWLRSAG